jgi:integrase
MEQCRHAFALMPNGTAIEKRNRAIFAFLMLTGARDGAIASVRLKHVNLGDACFYQDARDVKTKFAKTFTTWFFPVDAAYLECLSEWINYLRQELLFGHDDALFPKPELGLIDGSFATMGLSRATYGSAGKIREVIKNAFINAGLPQFVPHSFRKTLVKYGDQICTTREQFKAWSQNLGHDSVVTTISAYCPVSNERQAELIRNLGYCQ